MLHALALLASSTPAPSPSGSPAPAPSPTSSAVSALTDLGDRLTGGGTDSITCVRGSFSVCGKLWDWTGNLTLGQITQLLLGTPLRLIMIVLISVVLRRVLHRVIDRMTERIASGEAQRGDGGLFTSRPGIRREQDPPPASPMTATRRVARARTLASVLRSLTTAVVSIFMVLMLLQELEFDVAPLLAGAGVLGVALGFGSQSLVKDIVSGMFMIIEDQYGVGDVVDVGEATGTVEAVGLRITRLRDVNGTVWYVRNGEILRVGNRSQGWARAVLDVNVDAAEDIDHVEEVLLDVARRLGQDAAFAGMMLDEPKVWGVEAITEGGVVVRLVVQTLPTEKDTVARELRRRIKRRFGEEHIDMWSANRTLLVQEAGAPE